MNAPNLPPMTECPYCGLPIPVESTEAPYCDRKCFDSHIDQAIAASIRGSSKVEKVLEKIHRVSNNAGKHPAIHCARCSCYLC